MVCREWCSSMKKGKIKTVNSTGKKSISRDMYMRIREIIENSRGNIARAVNSEMVIAYWNIGREIIEEEQKGRNRAGYGQKPLETLAVRLALDYGKGFDAGNLWNMRRFYQVYPILDALSREFMGRQLRIIFSGAVYHISSRL